MTMRPDGTRLAFVSDVHAEEHQPEWSTLPPGGLTAGPDPRSPRNDDGTP